MMPTPQDELAVQRAYDQVADTYANHFRSTEPELPVDLGMIELFASFLPSGKRVLDAGCGAGRMMPVLETFGCQVEGIDLSPEMIRRAQQDHPSFPSQVASISALPFPDGSFDGVFSWYSTIHSPGPDLPRILAEARRVLRPAGLLLVAFQTGQGVRDLSEAYRRLGHNITLRRYDRTPEGLGRLLTSASMTEVARLERAAASHERTGQAVLIARV
ncbi:class I SAM-dependent methyltransferase [Sinomonas sp. G460-2]|uniref:class I SAM-dependent methyltransferase n=1 Tax=Sinomonas sp. G460-2 TaxID=3393464 RepID=UPI0039EF1C7C